MVSHVVMEQGEGPEGTTSADARLEQLTQWTLRMLGREDLEISPASADASFRRYFRARVADKTLVANRDESRTWIIMDAPPEKEDVRPFIKVSAMLVAAGINAPRVIQENLEEGFLLLSDLGNRTYLSDLVAGQRVDELYRDALTALVRMQTGCADAPTLPAYDAALLHREMQLFPDWFVAKHLGLTLDATAEHELQDAFAVLIAAALSQPRVFVHRDYHSRNLMVTGSALLGPNPGVLDFQDAVYGPITYDLVSLLRDCYVAWPLERIHAWLREYRSLASQHGLDVGQSPEELQRWFDLMGVQRHLKAIGIFARLWHRDGKQGYLADIPRTLGYIRSVAPHYQELHGLAKLIEERISPALLRERGENRS